ncbi:aminoglycoside phosphotransferase (APT) family kinase protein [Terracoccus luteus]|uniref:Aminoglycoside phosphotransferase (APT) family kinase protein n=1 Tax=Terracoccus luteus TaxID=53356 RepID=A0A495XUF5_9MICO|nr:phosphotransferase family protein [Terracoccus luteus]RKT76705.1 aminoglycoside phosphotransferase (APT) family kinase protein [Terracoccus luteus]
MTERSAAATARSGPDGPRPGPAGDPPGLDLGAVSAYLETAAPGILDGPLTARVVAGGKSNLTYEVGDGRRTVIVRRPPLGHVLETAHDMAREHRVMTALAGTAVPVPRTYALCTDVDVIGAPFYVMEHVAGTPYRFAAQLSPVGHERVRTISERLVDTLVELHAVDPDAVGLGDFGRPEGFLERQVRRWKRQLDASRSRDLDGIDDLHARLAASVPESGDVIVVHGDYRLDNLLVGDGDEVTAVLDWEMATVGDPLTDVALLEAYQALPRVMDTVAVSDVSRAPGFIGPVELRRRYADASGRDLTHLSFHLGLAYFKLAVILEGIHYRYTQGQTVGSGFAHIGDATVPLVRAGLRATEES